MIQNLPKPTEGLRPENFTPTWIPNLQQFVTSGNYLPVNLNPKYGATLQTAADFAVLMKLAAPSVPFGLYLGPPIPQLSGMFSCPTQVPWIEFGDGATINLGLYLTQFFDGAPASVAMVELANDMNKE